MAGGQQLQTPYGTIATPNITPDKATGIGDWSDDDFYKALHDGIDRSGNYIYPAMPFDHYTKATRQDVLAIKAYLFSLPPVHAPKPENHLVFPYDIRTALGAWRILFFRAGTFEPDPSRSAAENRGAYLVEGLGHCGSCHTPRDLLSGSEKGEKLAGGEIKGQGWFAPNITSDVREGIGGWSEQDLTAYLKSGIAPGHAIAAGPMTEVINDSLRYFTDQDLAAVVAYLKSTPAKETYTDKQVASAPGASEYLNHCAFCHQPDGKGIEGAVPPLAGNGVVLAGGPRDVIRTILDGRPAIGQYAVMPGMATQLDSAQIAEITNYVRTTWGNGAPATATTRMVDDLAKETSTMLSGTGGCDAVPPAVARAIDTSGTNSALRQINQDNMLEQIDGVLHKIAPADHSMAQADVVNGLTAAYCPIVMNDTTKQPRQRLELLQRFATLVYTRLHQSGPAGQASRVSTDGSPGAKDPARP
jgi:mono/diheme cytochrome c family protein